MSVARKLTELIVNKRKRNLILRVTVTVASLTIVGLAVKGSAQTSVLNTPFEIAQQQQLPSVRTRDVWKQIYQQLPDLPLENKYVSKEGRVDANNTLANRLIQYHVYVKGRSPNYRLDWKLTLADYLGANEMITETVYPGATTLKQNPLDGDRAIITQLNRKQRDALVQSLVNVFNPNSATPAATNTPPQPATAPSQETKPSFPQPKPGDARLLEP